MHLLLMMNKNNAYQADVNSVWASFTFYCLHNLTTSKQTKARVKDYFFYLIIIFTFNLQVWENRSHARRPKVHYYFQEKSLRTLTRITLNKITNASCYFQLSLVCVKLSPCVFSRICMFTEEVSLCTK